MNSDGTIGGFIAVQTDISEAKRTEYQQTLLRERMAEFAKMEALGTLAGGLAHDFNNVLGIVLSFCSMAHKNRDNHERFEDAIRTIELAVERGAGLSRQILTFARKHLPKLVHVDVNDLVLEVAGMLRPTFPKTISWSVTVAPDLPHIVADASQLHEVLVNLCVNARDAMPAGGTITLETSLAPESAPENGFPDALRSELVMIRVSDTGAGMSDEIKARAFDPFFTTKESGTGLGLAVAYGVITTLGGRIRPDSQRGRGTSFELLLPVSERRVERVEKLREVTGLGGTETVLLVEDEPLLASILAETLEAAGYEVLLAGDGEAALELVQRHHDRLRVVVSDSGLPGLSGSELFHRLRAADMKLPFIISSGFLDSHELEQLEQAGLDAYLQKPYQPDDMLRAIRVALDRK